MPVSVFFQSKSNRSLTWCAKRSETIAGRRHSFHKADNANDSRNSRILARTSLRTLASDNNKSWLNSVT